MYLVQIFVRLIGVEDDLPVVQNDPSRIQKVLTIFNEDLLSPGKNLKSKKVKKDAQKKRLYFFYFLNFTFVAFHK